MPVGYSAVRELNTTRFMLRRSVLPILLTLCCAALAQAQDSTTLAQDLVTIKGGYADKKLLLEELRIRAYIPLLLKAVGKGAAWKPGHPNWADTERRIAAEWRKLYVDYLARMGRDTSYAWMDDALAREYARLFSTEELDALLGFYRSTAGAALLALEKVFLEFYPNEMVRSLARVMFGNDTLSEREHASFRAPENRERRDFVALFETETIFHEESMRIGGAWLAPNSAAVQQGALATGADAIDALRRTLDAATRAEVQAFLKSASARKERAFLHAAVPAATPAQEDAALAKQEQAAFYKGLAELSVQWRTAANAGGKIAD